MISKKKGRGSPKKDSPVTARGKKKVAFKGYVKWTLSESHKVAFEKWRREKPDIDDLITKVYYSGYSLKIRYDDYNQSLSASLYCEDALSDNAGWVLSMRSNDWWKAICRVMYVHYVAFEGQWITEEQNTWDEDSW